MRARMMLATGAALLALSACAERADEAAKQDAALQTSIATKIDDKTALIRIEPDLTQDRVLYEAARAWSEAERDRYLSIGGPGASFESTWTRTFANARFIAAIGRVEGGNPTDREALGAAAGAVLDRRAGRLIALREIWKDDRDYGQSARVFAEALEPLALEAARAALDQKELDRNLADMISEEIRPDFSLYPAWALAPSAEPGKAGGIIVAFAPYRLGGVQPPLQVAVPISAIRKEIRPELLDEFLGGAAALLEEEKASRESKAKDKAKAD
jgi:hypothetical protein